ncbi:MAG: ATP-binding cassette domain-containing protein [Candidatus Auribacter fodinae]|jgi:lipopolysaccharide transport system ATP-binding protein|uniref:ATP-binding cassette domain-containing protein n=1 Tax=Candidatus Auribacter fodinae TaxID=2093366 RepID=A0A3A4R5W7_9BACT|nr:MAG: ATP-binding cassette domain-containing protein [Candidatus Auribacter fodinae]
MESIVIKNLSKCYRLGKRSQKIAGGGIDRLRQLLHIYNEDKKKHLARQIMALDNISLSVEEGTVLGIIGRNGAGKTTLLKVLARITAPTSGTAIVRGKVVSLLEIGVGFHPELTGRENIFLNAAIYGVDRRDVKKRFDDIVDFAEIEKFIDTPVRHYSSGMYLRLAFSMAINMEPHILLADEVLAVGDIRFQHRCLERMQQVGNSGTTVLFVSHDMEAIKRMCSRCICLDEGKIIHEGNTLDVTDAYQKFMLSTPNQGVVQSKGSNTSCAFASILSACLMSDQNELIGAVRLSQDFLIEFTYSTLKGDVDLFLGFDIYTRGIHVFRSYFPQPYHAPVPGLYKAQVRIPGNLLMETEYTVHAGGQVTHKGDVQYLTAYNILSFRTYDTEEISMPFEGTYHKLSAGVIRPVLEWEVTADRNCDNVKNNGGE